MVISISSVNPALKSIEDEDIQIQSRFMSDPSLSDIDFKNKMALVWTTLKILIKG